MQTPKQANLLENDVIHDHDATYWKLDVKNRLSYWSIGFINQLGFSINDISIGIDYFLDHLIHKNDRNFFKDNFYGFIENKVHFQQIIRILTTYNEYEEFHCKTQRSISTESSDFVTITFEKTKVKTPLKFEDDQFYYLEAAEMTSTGSWYVDLENKKTYWDRISKKTLGYPENYMPSPKFVQSYFHSDYHKLVVEKFLGCTLQGKPFNEEFKMLTSKKEILWTNIMGKAVYNNNRKIIGVRGVLQNINDQKIKELELHKTSEIISSQNSRLFNFAHIVSHNLRSHTSNLSLITELINDTNDLYEKVQLLSNVESASKSLSETIDHLNEVVTIQTNKNLQKSDIDLEDMLDQVKESILQIIKTQNAQINYDFSKVKTINYVPAYLESILLNLLTNAIKYRHTDRDPVINFSSYTKEDNIYLEVSDNGKGIDMEQFGDKIFGMYNTFHYNTDVESEVGKGTTFKIKF